MAHKGIAQEALPASGVGLEISCLFKLFDTLNGLI